MEIGSGFSSRPVKASSLPGRRNASGSSFFGILVTALFVSAFAAAGLFMTGLAANMLLQAMIMRGWREVPATILDAELKRNRDNTFQVRAEYEYEFDGLRHTGNTISLYGFASDNVGSFQKNVGHLLESIKPAASQFPVTSIRATRANRSCFATCGRGSCCSLPALPCFLARLASRCSWA